VAHIKIPFSTVTQSTLARVSKCVLRVCVGWLLVLSPAMALSLEELRAMEAAISDHPRQAIRQAQVWRDAGRASGDKALQLKGLRLLAMAHEQVEETALLKEDSAAGLPLARELADPVAECEFLGVLAGVATSENRYADATAQFNDAIAFAERKQLPGSRARLLAGKANVYLALGRGSEALSLLQEAHSHFERNGDKLWRVAVLSAMAGVDKGDPRDRETQLKAIDYYQQALALLDPKTSRYDVGTLYHNMGVAYAAMKEYAQARVYFEKSVAIVRDLDDPVSESYLRFRLGKLALEEKRYAEALADFDRAQETFTEKKNNTMLLGVQLARARALAGLDRRKDTLDALAQAQALAARLKTPNSDATYHETAADIYARLGSFEKAWREANALRETERQRAEATNADLTAELQTRFDVRQKDSENNVLRAQARESEARRLVLVLTLILCVMLVGGLVYYLVRNTQRSRRLANLAMRDDLTDLPNRRSILEFGQLKFRRRRESDEGICVALLDIDHFKSINDQFGHDRGDAVLIAFARTCQQQLRSNDRIGRFGGEEFLLIMPGSDLGQIPGLFDRLRQAVTRVHVDGLPASRRITFSLGAAAVDSPLDTLDNLIKRADEALYRAKQAGRDRFELAGSGEEARKASDLPAPATVWVSNPEHQALLKYEAILNNASVGIAFTRDRVFQHANPAFEDMFGWPRGGMMGQPGIAVWGSEAEYQELGRAVGPILGQGNSVELERKMKRRNGELFWCRIQARPIDPGNPAQGGTIWIIEDETERRNALERLQQLNDELAAANERLKAQVEEHQRVAGGAVSDI
jgi:diguanylate cyclase (GGDEF)-like protein/PAS domain S-box-containing protein